MSYLKKQNDFQQANKHNKCNSNRTSKIVFFIQLKNDGDEASLVITATIFAITCAKEGLPNIETCFLTSA